MAIGREEFIEKLEDKLLPSELNLVILAYVLAKYGHRGQTRESGERYFEHPKSCALILIDELKIYDPRMLCSALLHDLPEDSFILNFWDIEHIFGKEVKKAVQFLTKKSATDLSDGITLQKYFQKLRRSNNKTRILKLVDRLHNLRTLSSCDREKQVRKIKETIIYILPIAEETDQYLYYEIKKIIDAFLPIQLDLC
ncbi:MAG: HD domain-containing protein [Patescibacteria group bacterium]|nr:HD domain-containing protein [Patescibacteria group bacterium]